VRLVELRELLLDLGHGVRHGGDLPGHPDVGPAGRAAHRHRAVQPVRRRYPGDAQVPAVQHGSQTGPGNGDSGRRGQRWALDEHLRDQPWRSRRDPAEMHLVRVEVHGRALQRGCGCRGDTATVLLGQSHQRVPRSSGHREIGAVREPLQLAHRS
jgi:hypothetical protein